MEWSEEDLVKLNKLLLQYGRKTAQIADYFENRTKNAVQSRITSIINKYDEATASDTEKKVYARLMSPKS